MVEKNTCGQLKLISWGSITDPKFFLINTDPKFLAITDYCSCCNQQEKLSLYEHEYRNSYRLGPRAEK